MNHQLHTRGLQGLRVALPKKKILFSKFDASEVLCVMWIWLVRGNGGLLWLDLNGTRFIAHGTGSLWAAGMHWGGLHEFARQFSQEAAFNN